MQEKDIKRIVVKQLKTKFPYWRGLTAPVQRTSVGLIARITRP
ncbi:hypothetical protein [Desulfobacca acetoxidans]|uniref:Uncharacterized protein n=1 Tax=Desulfobacca acetoxidans (strain ATCC 700848 / DSM 11109 / ASRB2) TaxID=880072 RepID=F2ND36_DESAR|nr:hypothetical protein [Desulfobacca acetoxidans]AEB09760.1 hypothetical protein Desac_1924 [Desulfobacca acetoxidans DSM 11109]